MCYQVLNIHVIWNHYYTVVVSVMCLESMYISMPFYAPLVADLFLFSYERDFMMCLSDDKQADVIDALTLHPDIWTI